MTYSCSDFTDSILDALGIVVPESALDSPSDQADLALARITVMQDLLSECRTYLSQERYDETNRLVDRIDDVLGPVADAQRD